ncbi:MAG TPA: tRNA (adenosine(37)-N6)-threonylcarbamoyltransferase complex dimerization subunit type 1 TsaB [Syntrophorhabdaceae bacterium]
MESRLFLAIDNSIDFLNLVLSMGVTLLEERRVKSTLPPSQVLPGHVQQMLAGHGRQVKDLSFVAVTLGPGSFTGMRVALAFAKGLAAGMEIPLVGVPTLDVLASPFDFMEGHYILPVIDAKKGEVFTALYRASAGRLENITGYKSMKPGDIGTILKTPCICFGTGVLLCEKDLSEAGDVKIIKNGFRAISGEHFAREALRRVDDEASLGPALIYGRRSEAEIKFNVTVT